MKRGVYTDSPQQFRGKAYENGHTAMAKRAKSETTASGVWAGCDIVAVSTSVAAILDRGGAVMFGQTRDQARLIVTVYENGERDVEYVDNPDSLMAFLATYNV